MVSSLKEQCIEGAVHGQICAKKETKSVNIRDLTSNRSMMLLLLFFVFAFHLQKKSE